LGVIHELMKRSLLND
jgi:hypothetical protein